MEFLPNSGHVKLGACTAMAYMGLSMVVPVIMPDSDISRTYTRNEDMIFTAALTAFAQGLLGALLADKVLGMVSIPSAVGVPGF